MTHYTYSSRPSVQHLQSMAAAVVTLCFPIQNPPDPTT